MEVQHFEQFFGRTKYASRDGGVRQELAARVKDVDPSGSNHPKPSVYKHDRGQSHGLSLNQLPRLREIASGGFI
jgi:hypothetical protein